MSWKNIILAKTKTLPPFPRSVQQLARLMDDPAGNADRVEQILSGDPALAAEVLRLANSGLYSRGRTITSLSHAVSMLGLKTVFDLAVQSSLRQKLPRYLPGYDVEAATIMEHSIAVGVMSESLARRLGLNDPTYFTAGLLHDIGKLVIGTFLARHGSEMLKELQEGTDIVGFEKSHLELSHDEVGRMICERWNLPESISAAAGFHHDPLNAPENMRTLACVIHTADMMAHSWGFGSDAAEMARRLVPEALDYLKLEMDVIYDVAAQSLDIINEMQESIYGETEI